MLHAHECVSVFTQAPTHKGYSSIFGILLCLSQPFCLVTGVSLIEKKKKEAHQLQLRKVASELW